MKLRSALCLGGAAAVLLLAGGASPSFAAVGARVVVQEWSPLDPGKQGVHFLVDDPDIVSRSLLLAWSDARGQICAALKARLGAAGAAGGQTLYDIDCQLDPNATFTVASAGANALTATFTIRGNSITATSTQPTVLGSDFDPRFSLTLDASLVVSFGVQTDPNNTLRATLAKFTLGHASIDSHNASADVIQFVIDDLIPFFGGPNFKNMAENAVNAVSANLAKPFNSAFAPVNARLRGPSDYVRVGVWGRPDRITIAFGPRALTPPGGGAISGAVHWDPSLYHAQANCTSFGLQASVQTGPAPLLNPDNFNVVGIAPLRNVGSVSMSATSDRECRFTMSGVPAGWPNTVLPLLQGLTRVKIAGNTFFTRSVTLRPDGWSGAIVASASNKNFVVADQIGANSVSEVDRTRRDPLGPVASPYADRVDPGARAAQPPAARLNPATTLQTDSASRAAAVTQVQPAATSTTPQTAPRAQSPFAQPPTSGPAIGSTTATVGSALKARSALETAPVNAPSSALR